MIRKIIRVVSVVVGSALSFVNGTIIGVLIRTDAVKPVTFGELSVVVVLVILGFFLILAGFIDD